MLRRLGLIPSHHADPCFDVQEPHVYRMYEAVMHYGEAIKAIMNEELGAHSILTPFCVRAWRWWAGCKLMHWGDMWGCIHVRSADTVRPCRSGCT